MRVLRQTCALEDEVLRQQSALEDDVLRQKSALEDDVPTPSRLKLVQECNQWHSPSGVRACYRLAL